MKFINITKITKFPKFIKFTKSYFFSGCGADGICKLPSRKSASPGPGAQDRIAGMNPSNPNLR